MLGKFIKEVFDIRKRFDGWSCMYIIEHTNLKHIITFACLHSHSIVYCFTSTRNCIVKVKINEPQHDKTNKMTVRPAKTQINLGVGWVWSEYSLSAWRKLGSLATHWAHNEDSDQTGRMPRLIWVFAGGTVTLLVLSCCGSNRLLYPNQLLGTLFFNMLVCNLAFRLPRQPIELGGLQWAGRLCVCNKKKKKIYI